MTSGNDKNSLASEDRALPCHWSVVSSGISRFPHICIPPLLHAHLALPASTLKNTPLRPAKIFNLNSTQQGLIQNVWSRVYRAGVLYVTPGIGYPPPLPHHPFSRSRRRKGINKGTFGSQSSAPQTLPSNRGAAVETGLWRTRARAVSRAAVGNVSGYQWPSPSSLPLHATWLQRVCVTPSLSDEAATQAPGITTHSPIPYCYYGAVFCRPGRKGIDCRRDEGSPLVCPAIRRRFQLQPANTLSLTPGSTQHHCQNECWHRLFLQRKKKGCHKIFRAEYADSVSINGTVQDGSSYAESPDGHTFVDGNAVAVLVAGTHASFIAGFKQQNDQDTRNDTYTAPSYWFRLFTAIKRRRVSVSKRDRRRNMLRGPGCSDFLVCRRMFCITDLVSQSSSGCVEPSRWSGLDYKFHSKPLDRQFRVGVTEWMTGGIQRPAEGDTATSIDGQLIHVAVPPLMLARFYDASSPKYLQPGGHLKQKHCFLSASVYLNRFTCSEATPLEQWGTTVAERLACSPLTKAIRAQSQLGDLPSHPHFHFGAVPYLLQSPSSTLKTRVIEMGMEQRRNERAGETGDLRENPPTNGIVRHHSHMRMSNLGYWLLVANEDYTASFTCLATLLEIVCSSVEPRLLAASCQRRLYGVIYMSGHRLFALVSNLGYWLLVANEDYTASFTCLATLLEIVCSSVEPRLLAASCQRRLYGVIYMSGHRLFALVSNLGYWLLVANEDYTASFTCLATLLEIVCSSVEPRLLAASCQRRLYGVIYMSGHRLFALVSNLGYWLLVANEDYTASFTCLATLLEIVCSSVEPRLLAASCQRRLYGVIYMSGHVIRDCMALMLTVLKHFPATAKLHHLLFSAHAHWRNVSGYILSGDGAKFVGVCLLASGGQLPNVTAGEDVGTSDNEELAAP
ncbi:hypothetical protein PR048_027310 [Dryococelus australis]|uniref:Uncharacterized protein n=1 Tax=Dryococelus australis TaxID=614101 RepID=A0ABQ9GFJ8_9NEOP|nr:hypothetical protein PR048_027310 [Dryococelus australis]